MGIKFKKPKVEVHLSNPLSVCWQITKRCNFTCAHCIANAQANKEGYYEMNTSEVKSTINKLVDAGVVRSDFTGGEPLLRKDILEIIDYATKKGVYCVLTSNGSIYSKEIQDCLKRNESLIQISVDGDKTVHEGLRGKDNYGRTIKNLIKYTKAGIKTRINFTVTKQNVHLIDYIYKIAKDNKVSRLMYIFIAPQGRCYSHEDKYCLTGKAFEEARKKVRKIQDKGDQPHITVHNYIINNQSCFLIEPNGDVISQGYSQDDCIYSGNILTDSVKKIWDSGKFDHLKHFLQYGYLFEYKEGY